MARNTKANASAYYQASKIARVCPCGNDFQCTRFSATTHCSLSCGTQFRKGYCVLPTGHPARRARAQFSPPLGPLRQALQDGDHKSVVAILKADTVTTFEGCWEWQRRIDTKGYGSVAVGPRGKTGRVHRVMAEAVYGPLGREPVHHACANTKCCNPDHLQPISQRENVAEMLERNYYIARIEELESALRDLAPAHPQLIGRTA